MMSNKKQPAAIELTLDTASAAAGIDRTALLANVQAEIEKLGAHAKSKDDQVLIKEEKAAPPKGSQDLAGAIHWLITFAESPSLAPVYARGLIFGVNELLKAVQSDKAAKSGDGETRGVVTTLQVLGKTIALPAANKIIEEFLKSLSDGG